MNDEPAPSRPPPESGPPPGQSPRRGFGVIEWAVLLGIVGLIVYGQFFGGSC